MGATFGGKQARIRDSEVQASDLGEHSPTHDVSHPFKHCFPLLESLDENDGPFWMSKEERERRRVDIVSTDEWVEKDKNKEDF